jgi:peroxiredoxin
MGNFMSQQSPKKKRLPSTLFLVGGAIFIGLALAFLLFGRTLLFGQQKTPTQSALTQLTLADSNETRPSADTFLTVGQPAPNFTLTDLNGNSHTLSALAGQPVIINFWATWCLPCRIEMPELQTTHEQYAEQGLVILALNQEEDPETVRRYFYDEMDLTFTPLLDERGDVSRLYTAFGFPTTFFVNEAGMITAVHRGPLTQEQIEIYLAETIPAS